MELTYRGIIYQTATPSIEVTELSEKATFLGARFNRRHFQVNHHVAAPNQLTYRGVSYLR
ncbi:MAG: DUF4278 domain-containing protein [Nodosilinea sp.]